MGSDEAKQRWVEGKVDTWIAGVKRLVVFLILPPQTAYADLTLLLHQEGGGVVQHVTPGVGLLFAPLEATLREEFLRDLFGGNREDVTESLYICIAWGVNRALICILDPTQTAPANFYTSE